MNETTQAAPSTAVVEPEITEVQLPRSGSEEYANWRMTGELPKQPKAESAPADAPKEATPETAAESGPATKQQEQPKKGKDAEHRIKELLAEQKRLRAEVEAMRTRPQTQAEPPRQQTPQAAAEPTIDDKNADGSPKYKSYEEYVRAQARWEAKQEFAEQMRQIQAQTQQRQLAEGIEQARTRYQDFDQVGIPVANAIVSDPQIPNGLKVRINNSKVLPDLLYTIGGDPAFQARFMLTAKTDPEAARDVIALMERDIQERLSKPAKTEETPVAPARRGPENAPPPPIEIGNRGGPVNDTERLLKAAANGDRNATRQLLEAENRKMLARRRGA